MRNRVVPHFGHLPFIAGFPFFNFTFFGSSISRFARHFTQYAWTMGGSPFLTHRPGQDKYMGVTIFRWNYPSPQPHGREMALTSFYRQDLYNAIPMHPRRQSRWLGR